MAKRQSRSIPQKRSLLLAIAACVVLACAYGLFAHSSNKWPFAPKQTVSKVPPAYTPNQKQNLPSQEGPDAGKTSDQVPVSKGLVATITNLSEANQQVTFSASITGSSQKGTCVVTFSTPNDRPVTKQFDPTMSNQTATCPLTLSAQDFTYLGNWTATLHYYLGTEQATAQKDINIQ